MNTKKQMIVGLLEAGLGRIKNDICHMISVAGWYTDEGFHPIYFFGNTDVIHVREQMRKPINKRFRLKQFDFLGENLFIDKYPCIFKLIRNLYTKKLRVKMGTCTAELDECGAQVGDPVWTWTSDDVKIPPVYRGKQAIVDALNAFYGEEVWINTGAPVENTYVQRKRTWSTEKKLNQEARAEYDRKQQEWEQRQALEGKEVVVTNHFRANEAVAALSLKNLRRKQKPSLADVENALTPIPSCEIPAADMMDDINKVVGFALGKKICWDEMGMAYVIPVEDKKHIDITKVRMYNADELPSKKVMDHMSQVLSNDCDFSLVYSPEHKIFGVKNNITQEISWKEKAFERMVYEDSHPHTTSPVHEEEYTAYCAE